MEPTRLRDLHDLASYTFPPPPRQVEERRVNIEENSFWPIDIRPYSSFQRKQQDMYEFLQETLKASRSQVASEVTDDAQNKTVFWAAVIFASIGSILILGQFVFANFGAGFKNLIGIYTGGT